MRTLTDLLWTERKEVIYSIALGAISGITAIALFAQSGYMISKAALAPPFYTILILTAFLKLFGAVKSTSKYFERLVSHKATFQILGQIRMHFFERLEPQVPQLFTRYRSGDLLSRFVGDVETLQNYFLRVVYPPFVTLTVFLATIFFTWFFSVWFALILLIGVVLVAVIIPSLLAKGLSQSDVINKRASLTTEAAEYLAGFRDLKLHDQLLAKQQLLEEAQTAYLNEQSRTGRTQILSQSLNALVASFAAIGILAMGAYLVSTGEVNGLFLAMLTLVALTSFETAVPLAQIPAHLLESKQAMNRLEHLSTEVIPPKNDQLNEAPSYSIDLKDVTYRYPDAHRNTLQHITITLPAGSHTAIVGASGSGKTTLLQLIAGMVDFKEGEISFNNQSLHHLERESVWKQLGIQLQASHFFYGTIRDNLLIAKPEATDECLQLALQKAQLPVDLSAEVYEKGENLSGGEKQRLAIARLFLTDAKIWLLDEPYTSLDAITEARLANEIETHVKEQTLLLISHKLEGLEHMDQIIVMDQGEIVEVGNFKHLIEKQGMFYEMIQIEQQIV